eukprot:1833859-Amphidinium_carterae.1
MHHRCYGGWSAWWQPCIKHKLDFKVGWEAMRRDTYKVDEEFLSNRDVCEASAKLSIQGCRQALVERLAPTMIQNIVDLAFVTSSMLLVQGATILPNTALAYLAFLVELSVVFAIRIPLVAAVLPLALGTYSLVLHNGVRPLVKANDNSEVFVPELAVSTAIIIA